MALDALHTNRRGFLPNIMYTGLFSEVGFWSDLMPQWLVKPPGNAEGRAIVGKWKQAGIGGPS